MLALRKQRSGFEDEIGRGSRGGVGLRSADADEGLGGTMAGRYFARPGADEGRAVATPAAATTGGTRSGGGRRDGDDVALLVENVRLE